VKPRATALATALAIGGLLLGDASPLGAAEPLAARDTATILPRRVYSIGVFDPLRVGLGHKLELATHPVFDVLLAPNAVVRSLWLEGDDLRLVGEYGLSIPTMAMRELAAGYLFPEWEQEGGQIGWFVVPSAAAVVAGGTKGIWTARVETAVGIGIGPNDATLPESWAPLDLVFAPALTGLRSRVGFAYDHPLASWLRIRGALDLWMVGKTYDPPRSSLYESVQVALDFAVGTRKRLVLGASVYDSDQHRTEVVCEPRCSRRRLRSLDLFPVIDFIWQP
jgi:hypothetical protein